MHFHYLLTFIILCTQTTIPPDAAFSDPTADRQFVCPPCGLNCDQLTFEQPGRCQVCLMQLITTEEIAISKTTFLYKLKQLDLINFLVGLGVAQGIFMLFLLFSGGRRNPANLYLAGLIIGIICGCCYYLLLEYRVFYQYPGLSLLPLKMSYLIGTSLYLYVCRAIGIIHSHKRVLMHYLPAILVALSSALMILLDVSPVSRFYAMYDLYLLGFAGFAHILVYLILTYRLLNQYKSDLDNNYSQIPSSQSQWFRKLAIFVFLLLALITTYVVITLVSPQLALGRYFFLFWILASSFVIGSACRFTGSRSCCRSMNHPLNHHRY